jgi:hypothetical protein
MYVWAICRVSNLLSLWSAPRLGTTSRNLSKASFRPFIRRRSRAFAARRRRLRTVGEGGTSRDLLRLFRGLDCVGSIFCKGRAGIRFRGSFANLDWPRYRYVKAYRDGHVAVPAAIGARIVRARFLGSNANVIDAVHLRFLGRRFVASMPTVR